MHASVRRATGFAAVGLLALFAPVLDSAASAPFAVIALLAVVTSDGPLFTLFARPADYDAGRLRGLFGFALSAAVLGVLAGYQGLPMVVFVVSVLLVAAGNLGAVGSRIYFGSSPTAGYLVGGFFGATTGIGWMAQTTAYTPMLSESLVLVLIGSLAGALIHSMLFHHDDPSILFSVAFLLWLLLAVDTATSLVSIGVAVGVAGAVGVIAYALDAASVEGMVAGILLGLLTIVLGGYEWFALLLTFFAVGGASTKFRYDQKRALGVAEDNGGARGGENVLANAGAAMAALVYFALVDAGLLVGDATAALFVFAGAIATALSDTLASEIGGSYGQTRLITTLEPVAPGTDGGVTWQGFLAGAGGGALAGGLAYALFPAVSLAGAGWILAAGLAGMLIDSLLGATLEGALLGNSSVNFIATVSGGLLAGLAVVVGIG